jgi:hypothetical protein
MHRFVLAEFRSERHSPPGDPGRTPDTTTRRTMTAHDREQRIDGNLQQRVHNDLMAGYTVNPSARYPDPDQMRKGGCVKVIGPTVVSFAKTPSPRLTSFQPSWSST